jgi:RNase P/RNase MRP subunit POP5
VQIAKPFLLTPDGTRRGDTGPAEARPWVIEPWLAAPADIVVCDRQPRRRTLRARG